MEVMNMFCKNCGANLANDAKFCANCGQAMDGAQTNVSAPAGRKETLVVEVSKEREQKTITNYQKLGWTLTNNQEVNVTSVSGGGSTVNGNGSTVITSSTKTYIKLTFERNTGMKNFAELDAAYKKYKALENEYITKENEIAKKGFSVKILLIVALIVAISATVLILAPLDISFDDMFDISILIYVLVAGISGGLMIGAGVSGIVGAIGKANLKKKYAPRFTELDAKMDEVANEAEKYLY